MEEPKTPLITGVQNFVQVAKERAASPSSPWWDKVAYVAGPVAGGMSFVMTIDGIPKWTKYVLGFLIGCATYYVPKKFGTTTKSTAEK